MRFSFKNICSLYLVYYTKSYELVLIFVQNTNIVRILSQMQLNSISFYIGKYIIQNLSLNLWFLLTIMKIHILVIYYSIPVNVRILN